MSASPRSLHTLANRFTRYEVIVELNNGNFIVGGYVVSKNRAALMAVMYDNGPFIVAVGGDDEDIDLKYSKKDGLRVGSYARIYFNGRTERDAASEIGK